MDCDYIAKVVPAVGTYKVFYRRKLYGPDSIFLISQNATALKSDKVLYRYF
jgi:hypothetical protein